MNRWKLGKSCLRKVPISGIGIMNYQGSEESVKKIMSLLPNLRSSYSEKFTEAMNNLAQIS